MDTRWLWYPLSFCLASLATAETPLRIEQLARCGDLLDHTHQHFCLRARGLADGELELRLGGQPLPAERQGSTVRFERPAGHGGTVLLAQGGRLSNPAWLSAADNHVLAAGPGERVVNPDGLDTAVALVGVLLGGQGDSLARARELARNYGASVVGGIAPLHLYQLRLAVRDLAARDAQLLRLRGEAGVQAVLVDEHSAEAQPAALPAPAPQLNEWAANRFADALNYYRRRVPARGDPLEVVPLTVGVVEGSVDFDAAAFSEYTGDCQLPRTCVYASDAAQPDGHGSNVVGVLAAHWQKGGNTGLLRGLDGASKGFRVLVSRDSDSLLGRLAASVNLAEDGARVLNWSWGVQPAAANALADADSQAHSALALAGDRAAFLAFFRWLQHAHPNVLVVNAAGAAGDNPARLPSSLALEQLLVVGGHQRGIGNAGTDPQPVGAVGAQVDISAAACTHGTGADEGTLRCGTAYAAPMATALVAAMLSINPALGPGQLRAMLRRSALPIGASQDFGPESAHAPTAPLLPSERNFDLENPDIGRSAELGLQKALDLAVQSRERRR